MIVRSRKTASVSLVVLCLLVGCGDNEPSNSEIEKQLSSQLSPCPELSISNFQKINGYPQNDGSYIDQVQYNIDFTPSDDMLSYVADYKNKQKTIANEGASDTAKIQTAKDQASTLACESTYRSEMHGLNDSLSAIPSLSSPSLLGSEPDEINPSYDVQVVDDAIASTNDWIKSLQTRISSDESSNSLWPQQRSRDDYGNMVYMTQEQATTADQNTLSKEQNFLNLLEEIKTKLANSVNQVTNCQGTEQKIIQSSQSAIDNVSTLNAELTGIQSEDLDALRNEMNKDCSIVIPDGVLALFNANANFVESYGRTYTVTESENVHLVKSDNGWIIQ